MVLELKTWKMSQLMTLTDGDKCLIERYEFLMNYATIHSVKLDDAEPNLTGFISWKCCFGILNAH